MMENVSGFPNPNDENNGENEVDADPTSVSRGGGVVRSCKR